MIRTKYMVLMAERLMEEARAREGEPAEEALWEAARSLFHAVSALEGVGSAPEAELPPRPVLCG